MTSRTTLFALAACLALGGCGPKKNYKYRIAVIPKGLTHEHWQSVHRGADRAAADLAEKGLKVEIIWQGPQTESDALEQIGIIDRNIGRKVSGFVLAPQDSKQMVKPVELARADGIPTVIIDSNLDKDELAKDPGLTVKYVATDNYNGGKLAAEHLLRVLEQAGNLAPRVVLFRYAVGSESTEQREKGFEDEVNRRIAEQKARGEPTITWVSNDKYAGATRDTAQREASPLISQFRDQIDGIFAVNESSASGVVESLRSLGLNKKIVLVGFDSSGPLLQAVRDGDVEALIVQDPYRMGYLGVWELVQHLEGKDVTPGGQKVESTGEYVVTRENLDAPATRELFDPEAQAKRTLKAPEYGK